MKERIEQLKHLAEVLHAETKNIEDISVLKAKSLQDTVDEIQDELDKIFSELYKAE